MAPGTRSPEPFAGAVPLPLDGVVPRASFEPERRRAFGSVPRLLGVNLELNLELTASDRQHAAGGYLRDSLFSSQGQQVNGLALNPAEYATVLINAPTFEERIGARAERAHKYSNPIRREEAKLNAPWHAYQDHNGLLEKHQAVVTGLAGEVSALEELMRYIRARGYALTNEGRIRQLATYAWQHSFDNILEVASNQRGWTRREHHGAVEAVATNLVTGPQNQRIGYWGGITGLAHEYAKKKRALFTQRQHVVESRIKVIEKQRDIFYADHGIQPLT